MTREECIKLIAGRIITEQIHLNTVDAAHKAAEKIYKEWREYFAKEFASWIAASEFGYSNTVEWFGEDGRGKTTDEIYTIFIKENP